MSAYHNPFDLAAQSQSFGDQTNPSALVSAFGNASTQLGRPAPGDAASRHDHDPSAGGGQPGRKKWSARPHGQQDGGPQHRQREHIDIDNDYDELKEEELLPEPETQPVVKRNRFSNAQHGAPMAMAAGSDDEDSYSDDDFEVQVDSAVVQENVRGKHKAGEKSLQVIHEFTNESHDQDYSAI